MVTMERYESEYSKNSDRDCAIIKIGSSDKVGSPGHALSIRESIKLPLVFENPGSVNRDPGYY